MIGQRNFSYGRIVDYNLSLVVRVDNGDIGSVAIKRYPQMRIESRALENSKRSFIADHLQHQAFMADDTP